METTMKISVKTSHWEGDHTSYSWTDPINVMVLRTSGKTITFHTFTKLENRKGLDLSLAEPMKTGYVYRIGKDQFRRE